MKVPLSHLKMVKTGNDKDAATILSEWLGSAISKKPGQPDGLETSTEDQIGQDQVSNRPIEPETGRPSGASILKWVLLILFVGYGILSYYHVPLLTALGNYLIVEHPLRPADVIVCTPGMPVEQSLMAAELYKRGMAPRLFIPDEAPPDGFSTLKERGVQYPDATKRFVMTLEALGVPGTSCIVGKRVVNTVQEEAEEIRDWAMGKGYDSMIIITSPPQTRSVYLIFKNLFDTKKTELMMAPSRYSGFRADTWWKTDKNFGEVIFEYLKLLFYTAKGLW